MDLPVNYHRNNLERTQIVRALSQKIPDCTHKITGKEILT